MILYSSIDKKLKIPAMRPILYLYKEFKLIETLTFPLTENHRSSSIQVFNTLLF